MDGKYKAATIEDVGDQGLVVAKIAHFGNYDRENDRVFKGAFATPFSNLASSPVPVFPKHMTLDPLQWCGQVVKGWEDNEGAFVENQLYLDEPGGERIFKRLKARTLRDWSYWGTGAQGKKNSRGGDDVTHFDAIRETSPAMIGMNPLTGTIKVAGVTDPASDSESSPGASREDQTVTSADRARIRIALL